MSNNAIDVINNAISDAQGPFQSVLVDRSINFEREAKFALQILTSGDYVMSIARDNPQSVIDAVTNIAAIGISLNPALKQAYLVPRKRKICLDISYMGLMDLAMATGSLRWAQAQIVHQRDQFALNGFDHPPTHIFNPFATDRGEIVGAYVVVKTADGEYLTSTMSVDAINDIRDRSEAWKAWISKKTSCPWVTDYNEMAKKTVVKNASKYWPRTDRLDVATHYLNTDGGEGIDTKRIEARTDDYIDAEPIIDGLRNTTTIEQMKAYWAEKNGLLAGQQQDHQRLKDAYLAHLSRLKAQQTAPTTTEQEQS